MSILSPIDPEIEEMLNGAGRRLKQKKGFSYYNSREASGRLGLQTIPGKEVPASREACERFEPQKSHKEYARDGF